MAIRWHAGEVAIQRRAAKLEQGKTSVGMIREAIPGIAVAFLSQQPMIVVAGRDGQEQMWVSVLAGEPGFLQVTDPRRLRVRSMLASSDPLAAAVATGGPFGTITLEPGTGRRMRINGTVVPAIGGFELQAEQVFSNCPKYISERWPEAAGAAGAPQVVRGTQLTPAQALQVQHADTFFIGTAHPDGPADASHKAGNPGFVRVDAPDRLRWPDYIGNAMFMTLGNLSLDPRAGLLFIDWTTGGLLQLSGRARVDWEPGSAALLPGAQRVVEFCVDAVQESRDALALRWTSPVLSRFNPAFTVSV